MGAAPKTKVSRHRRGNRRQHQRLDAPHLVTCKNCGEMMRSHYVCKKCGMIAAYNDGTNRNRMYANSDFTIHLCKTCNNTTDFAKVEIPYAYKLLSQELQTINVSMRLMTE